MTRNIYTHLLTDCTLDVAILIDHSGSIRDDQVAGEPDNFELLMFFVEEIIRNLPVGLDRTRVGIILFSNRAEVFFDLDDFSNSQAMIDKLDKLVYEGGNTNTTGMHLSDTSSRYLSLVVFVSNL